MNFTDIYLNKNVDAKESKKQIFFPLLSIAVLSALIFGGNLFGGGKPLFDSLDNFVLFTQEEIKLEQGVQVSSGDLGSNGEIDIQKDVIINGNLFADKISIDKNTTINGNVSFNKLKTHKEAQILGTQTKPVSLPIANLPEIPEFQIGTQDFKFQEQDNTLSAGSYRNIILEKDSRLTLIGGIYNLRKLELKENSTLIFSAPTTLNIQFKLKGQQKVSILPGPNLKLTDLSINYLGIKPKKEVKIEEDDEAEINGLLDEKERKDCKDGKIGRPVVFDKNSFLNFKLLAPKANVHIGEVTTFRGQIMARKIKIGKGGILSREEVFAKESDPEKVIIDTDGSQYVVNEIMVNFIDSATFSDAQAIVNLVGGRIVGFVESANAYQIEVTANTADELSAKIQTIRQINNPLVEGVFRSYILKLISL